MLGGPSASALLMETLKKGSLGALGRVREVAQALFPNGSASVRMTGCGARRAAPLNGLVGSLMAPKTLLELSTCLCPPRTARLCRGQGGWVPGVRLLDN